MSGDHLPSSRETPTKQSILDFVDAVTDRDSADFVEEPDRVAVFDNDGTLWTEQPAYAQLVFALDRAAELGHPTSIEELHAGGMAALTDLLKLTHAGITTEEFAAVPAAGWHQPGIHASTGRIRRRCISPCWSCSACWTAAASPAGSFPEEARTSCGPGRARSTACRPTG